MSDERMVVIYQQDAEMRWHWSVQWGVAASGARLIIARCRSEGYETKSSCEDSLVSSCGPMVEESNRIHGSRS